jgi:hypothetical protein
MNCVPTWDNKCVQNLETSNIFVICGIEREVWSLPELSTIANSGKEWILHLLDGRSEMERL